jgi:hypothetical protein
MVIESPSGLNMSKGFGELLNYTNRVTNQWISNMLLISLWVIILIGYYKAMNDFKGAFAVSSYGTFVVALLLWVGGFVSGVVLSITIAFAIIGTLVLLLDQ